MARSRPEFEPGSAGGGPPKNASFFGQGVAAQLEQVERRGPRRRIVFGVGCSRGSNSVAGDAARTDFTIPSGIYIRVIDINRITG